ncbi:MAG: DUF2147 domain-containing protein [Paraburkholderia sp.]|jgi:uncharacterized protein (DUF2147 family)
MYTVRFVCLLIPVIASAALQPAFASDSDDAKGLWRTADGNAVVEFKACSDEPSSLCGTIVWDKDAGTASNACGVLITKLTRYEDDAWRDGWVFDPRTNRRYKGVVRVNSSGLAVRAYIGTEMLGETEQMTHEQSLPLSPICRK